MLGMLGDKKKIIQLILAESPMKKDKEVPSGLEGDFSPALEAYAKDMLSAIKEDNAKAFAMAFKEFLAACEQEEEYTEGPEQMEG